MLERFLTAAAKVFFALTAGFLCLLAIGLVLVAIWTLASGLFGAGLFSILLRSIGIVIVGIAVFDIGKFLLEQELVHEPEMRSPAQARGSLTKFMSIIIIAICLESLVLILETKFDQIEKIVYPTILLLVAVAAVVALGLFQRLSRAESDDAPRESQERRRPDD